MTPSIFDSISHTDFLRLTLEAFARQGFAVEQSSVADADAVLRGRDGARIGILCKKYRGAFIGRPVLQQFHGAMVRLRCKEGYLVTTTDCSKDAYDFAAGKGIVLYNRERTTELLRTAFGDAFIRSGAMPELGRTAKAAAPAARQSVSAASYEKVAAPELKKAQELEKPQAAAKAPEPVQAPRLVQEPVQVPVPVQAPEPVHVPEPVQAPELEKVQEPEKAPEPAPAPEAAQAPPQETAGKELPEEVQEVESIESPGAAEALPPERSTIIVCLECNKQLRVPIDQGMITVQCPECGMRRIYQPELNDAGELKTTTVITCRSCSQKLNVPTDRGQLKVRCPQCKAAWLFTP